QAMPLSFRGSGSRHATGPGREPWYASPSRPQPTPGPDPARGSATPASDPAAPPSRGSGPTVGAGPGGSDPGLARYAAPIPDEVPVEVRVLEPQLRRAGMSSMKGSLNTKARRKAGTRMYLASVALSSFAKFMMAGDSLKEVATVVRDGGTS